ncbi:hypothetical protein [Brevifollis gellanilyticus]|uniref:hypothetical protein n=1 Tax=Brevifollis gellanilyticus TaxID=748831 RepID=UPI0011BDDA96|nr:hypothetical protein [Brevifollis gellanilyticus]
MKPHLPALLILLLGAAFYLHRRDVLHASPAPSAKPASSHSSAAKTSAKPVQPPPGSAPVLSEPPPQIVQRFESELKARQPELKRELSRNDAELEISRWQRVLDWTPAEVSAVRRLAMPKIIARAEARVHGGLSPEAYQAGVAAARAALDEAMLEALGNDRSEAWRRASQRARERSIEDRVNSSLRVIEDVISLESAQKDRLHAALTARASAEPTGPADDSLVLKVSHDAGILPPLSDEIILAKDILTPEQMIQFDLAQESQRKMSEIVLDSFRRLLSRLATSSKS